MSLVYFRLRLEKEPEDVIISRTGGKLGSVKAVKWSPGQWVVAWIGTEDPVLGLCKPIQKCMYLRKNSKRWHLRINRNGKDKVRFMSGIGQAHMILTSKGRRTQGVEDEDS